MLSIDFVAHGDAGYAGSWAQRTRPGDRLQFDGPGGSYRPSPDVDWHLLIGDESAFGAIGATLESLQPNQRALVFAIAEAPGCEVDFPTPGDVSTRWLYRQEVDARLPAEETETWVAGAVASTHFPGFDRSVDLPFDAEQAFA